MLSPKPTHQKPLLSWTDLDKRLQANFTKQRKDKPPSLTVDLNEFEMSFDEVKQQAESNGYKITKLNGSYIKFE